jgi:hypothetical protein
MRVGDHLIERLGARTPTAEELAPTRNLDPHKDGEALA